MRASRILPGEPPEIYKEWDTPLEHDGEVRPWAQTNGRDGNALQSIYGGADIPLFGPQYGISTPSRKTTEDFPVQSRRVMRFEVSNPYEDMMRNAAADLERVYLESLESSKGHETQADAML